MRPNNRGFSADPTMLRSPLSKTYRVLRERSHFESRISCGIYQKRRRALGSASRCVRGFLTGEGRNVEVSGCRDACQTECFAGARTDLRAGRSPKFDWAEPRTTKHRRPRCRLDRSPTCQTAETIFLFPSTLLIIYTSTYRVYSGLGTRLTSLDRHSTSHPNFEGRGLILRRGLRFACGNAEAL